MPALPRLTATLAAALLLAACASEPKQEGPLVLSMATPGIGDVVISDATLRFDDGSEIAVQRVAEGVYAVPSRPARTPAGADICQGRPAGYFTLHRTSDGLYVMNWGDWTSVPKRPSADMLALPDACATFTFNGG